MSHNLRKVSSAFVLLLGLSFALVFSESFIVTAEANTIVVPDDYSTIQEALLQAFDGDTIFVKKGTYEIVPPNVNDTLLLDGLKVNKTLSIIGEDSANTVLMFPPDTRTGFPLLFTRKMGFVIRANDFTISNLTIENCDFGIQLKGNQGTISNIITSSILLQGNYTTVTKTRRISSDVYQFPARLEGCFNTIVQNTGFEMECLGSNNYLTRNSGNIEVTGDFNLITGHKNLVTLELLSSNFNQITNNSIRYLRLAACYNNTISGNKIDKPVYKYGLLMGSGSGNVFCGNIIANFDSESGYFGMRFGSDDSIAENNTFYHNNFINNYNHVGWVHEIAGSGNYLDNGLEGNYWDDYDGIDSNGDGIGDTPYIVSENHQDNHPLMEPVLFFDAGTWEGIGYVVDVSSNSSVSNFEFNRQEKQIRFSIDTENETVGFCRVIIPHDLLSVEGNNWAIWFIDGTGENIVTKEDTNNAYLSFLCDPNVKTIEIFGTKSVPEFSSVILLVLVIFVGSVFGVLVSRNLGKKGEK